METGFTQKDSEGLSVITATYTQQYMKAYADDSAKGRGHYRDVTAYLDACRKIFDDYCDGKPADQQVHTWRGLLRVPWKLAAHDALLAEDMPALNDALFHFAAAEGCRNWTGSTPDYAYPTVKRLLAAGMFDRVPLLLPEEFLDRGTWAPMASVVMVLWHGREDLAPSVRVRAHRHLERKQPKLYEAELRYLLALLDEDPEEASTQLSNYVNAVSRVSESGVGPLEKLFWPFAHGLYNLAWKVWPEDRARSIRLPEHERFCDDLALWQSENGFPAGTVRISYPEPLGLVNTLLAITPPPLHLLPHEDAFDEARYRAELTTAVLASHGRS